MNKLLILFIFMNVLLSGSAVLSENEQLPNNIALSSTHSKEAASSQVSVSSSEASGTEKGIEGLSSDNEYSDELISKLPITFEEVEIVNIPNSHQQILSY